MKKENNGISTIERPEAVFHGIPVAPGLAYGPAYLYSNHSPQVKPQRIEDDEVQQQFDRFEEAVLRSEIELKKIVAVAREKIGVESANIFEAQLLMLRDPSLYQVVLERIQEDKWTAAYAVQYVMDAHRKRMEVSSNEYLRERSYDLLDIQHRLIRNLSFGKLVSQIDQESIVVGESLTAADLVLFSRRQILGCAIDHGGATSHVSIMARSLRVPAVVGLHNFSQNVTRGDTMILDGLMGTVILNPTAESIANFRIRQERYANILLEQEELRDLPPITEDGIKLTLRANLEFEEEVDLLKKHGAEGIGLFRTEMLFISRGRFPSEEEHFEVYRDIVRQVSPEPVTFRLFDLGGDKMLPLGHREQNPFLGWRGIRILLDRLEVLGPQLRALLRASVFGPIRLLVPMVTTLEEVIEFKNFLAQKMTNLEREGIDFDHEIQLGIMVEVPAVALMADRFAKEVDFFSIGSNDLTQYTLAVDRGNDLVADIYQEFNPAVLALIDATVQAAHRNGIPVSLCGEMAGRPQSTPILLGLGLDELSAVPSYLPEVKRVIRSISLKQARRLATRALQMPGPREVKREMDKWLRDHQCGLDQRIGTYQEMKTEPHK